MINSNFEIDFFSDDRYENITIEISYKKQILCQLNKDRGIEKIEIEFFYDSRLLSEKIESKFFIDDFISILNKAKKDLIDS